MNRIALLLLFCMVLFFTGLTSAVDNPQCYNPLCGTCSSYGHEFVGPLEHTPYEEPLNDCSYQPGNIYVVYSVIPKEETRWTQNTGTWQAWGPYEFQPGKGYILEFGPHDCVGMSEGTLPYYVEGTASWLQSVNYDYFEESAYSYCIVSEDRFEKTSGCSVLDYTTTSKIVDGFPVDRQNTFTSTDEKVIFWVELGPVYGGEDLKTVWTDPQGNDFSTTNYRIKNPHETTQTYHWLSIPEKNLASYPGTWSVSFFFDGEYLLSEFFVMEGKGEDIVSPPKDTLYYHNDGTWKKTPEYPDPE